MELSIWNQIDNMNCYYDVASHTVYMPLFYCGVGAGSCGQLHIERHVSARWKYRTTYFFTPCLLFG